MPGGGNIRNAGKEVGTAFVITPDSNNNLDQGVTRGIYVGISGDLTVDMVDGGTNITFPALAAGICHPLCVTRVYATSTADDIIGLQ